LADIDYTMPDHEIRAILVGQQIENVKQEIHQHGEWEVLELKLYDGPTVTIEPIDNPGGACLRLGLRR
jgi:hypothetical protein